MTLPLPRWVLLALAAAALASGIDNLTRPLANPDEGRYSEISREMAATGDWVTPRLNGIKYFEKPPLQYWASAAAFKAFGENEAAARLYVGLCGLLTVLIVAYTALRLWDAEAAFAAALVLVSSPYFMALGGIVTLDMGLTLWTTATLCALLIAEHSRERPREHRRWMLASWAGMALAVLSKGLVGIVFPGAALFFYCVLRRDLSILRRLEWLFGLPLFFAIAAPWFIAVSAANPEFARFFFIHPRVGIPAMDVRAARGDSARLARGRRFARIPANAPGAPLERVRGALLQRLELQASRVHPARIPAARACDRALPRDRLHALARLVGSPGRADRPRTRF